MVTNAIILEPFSSKHAQIQNKMQLDIEVSPPAFWRFFIRHCTLYYIFYLDSFADLDPCNLWSWPLWLLTLTLTHVTLDLQHYQLACQMRPQIKFLTDQMTKFDDRRCNGSWDMNLLLVTDIQKAIRINQKGILKSNKVDLCIMKFPSFYCWHKYF